MGKRFCGFISAAGLLLLIGTAGASDQNLIPLSRVIWQSLTGLALFAGAGTLGGFILDRLQHRHGVICYDADTRELFVINWLRNHWNSSPKCTENAQRSIRRVKSRWLRLMVRAQFLRAENENRCAEKKGVRACLRTPFRP